MAGSASWADLASLTVSALSLLVTVAIYRLGRRLSFRQQRERVRELEARAWEVLGPIRTQGLNSKVIVMNVARYQRGYDGSNELTWRGWVYRGAELIETVHGGVEVNVRVVDSYLDAAGHRTVTRTPRRAQNVLEVGHIPWSWIEDIAPEGDEFDGSAILFVRHRAPGREPYDYLSYREATPVPFGPSSRDYFCPLPDLGLRRPRLLRDRWRFLNSLRFDRKMRSPRQA